MAKRKILDYDGLQTYDSTIKEYIEAKTANLDNAVLTTAQELTDEQKAQARANIGAYNYDWHHIPYSESYPDKLYASNINGSGNGINDWDLAMSSVGSNGTSNLHALLNSIYTMSKGTSVIHSNITSKIPAFFQAIVSTGALMNDNNIQLIITYDSDITFRKAHVCLLNYNSSTDKYILIVDDDYHTNIQFTSDGTITFNSLVKEIDNTLSQPYRPAGSKAVGDALALKADKTALDEAIDAIQPMTIEEIDAICAMDDIEALVIAEYLAEATDSEGNTLTDNQDNTYVF